MLRYTYIACRVRLCFECGGLDILFIQSIILAVFLSFSKYDQSVKCPFHSGKQSASRSVSQSASRSVSQSVSAVDRKLQCRNWNCVVFLSQSENWMNAQVLWWVGRRRRRSHYRLWRYSRPSGDLFLPFQSHQHTSTVLP